MTKLFSSTLFFLLAYGTVLSAQVKAITEFGDTIYVFDDGTWGFSPDDELDDKLEGEEFDYLEEIIKIDTITAPFVVSNKTNKEARSKFDFFTIKYNSNEWKRLPPAELNPIAEIAFKAKNRDIYCMVITEELEIGQENLFKIALNNAKEKSGNEVDLKFAEHRTINGAEVIRAVYTVNINGLHLIFDAYFYSTEKGSIQFMTWTGNNLWEKCKDQEIAHLLNGLVVD